MKKIVVGLFIALLALATAVAERPVTARRVGQAVQGTVLNGNVATAKDGYRFIGGGNRQTASVERTRYHQYIGTYACVSSTTGQTAHCQMEVQPATITCGGEAGGGAQCVLRNRPPVMQ